jgi:hypothetical protein
MTTVTQASEYMAHLSDGGFGRYSLKLGTRGLESLRLKGTL